ncbi:MAG: adenosine deaminase family protein [Opitutales bacterium]
MPYSPDPELASFIQSIPKTETHLHVEGSMPWQLLQEIDPELYTEPPPGWADDFKYKSFREFEDYIIEHTGKWFTSAERYHKAAKGIFQHCADSNVKYVETSFHSGIVAWAGIPGREIVDAILEAVPEGIEAHVYMGMLRLDQTPEVVQVLEDALSWERLKGIDLHGPEEPPIQDWTPKYFERAAGLGKRLKAHAGEFGPSEWVTDALDKLKVKRIQHGVRSIEDPAVVQRLVEENITLDVCPISNIKLDVFDKMSDHPIRKLSQAGVSCTLNTDDPFIFGNSLNEEYAAVAMELGCTHKELIQFARNGWDLAECSPAMKSENMAELDRLEAGLS